MRTPLRALILGAALALDVCASGQGQAQSPTVSQIGSCAALNIDAGGDASSTGVIAEQCDLLPVMSSSDFGVFQSAYAPFFATLYRTFLAAEVVNCGYSTCATGGRDTKILVVSDGEVGLGIAADDEHFEIFITSGFIDFVYGSTAYLTWGLVHNDEGLAKLQQYWRQMKIAGGKTCTRNVVKTPIHGTTWQRLIDADSNLFTSHVNVIDSTFVFLFSHELAHALSGSKCGSSSENPLAIESACDAIAFAKMTRWKEPNVTMPFAYISHFMSMAHYEALYYQPLGELNRRPFLDETLYELFPARDWQKRSVAMQATWEGYCQSAGSQGTDAYNWLCEEDAMRKMRIAADQWTRKALPDQCIATSGNAWSEGSEPTFCIDLENVASRAEKDFQDLKGKKAVDDDKREIWDSIYTVTGFGSCQIRRSKEDDEVRFTCSSPTFVDQTEMKFEFDQLVGSAKQCGAVGQSQMRESVDPDDDERTFRSLGSNMRLWVNENTFDGDYWLSIRVKKAE